MNMNYLCCHYKLFKTFSNSFYFNFISKTHFGRQKTHLHLRNSPFNINQNQFTQNKIYRIVLTRSLREHN